MKVLYSLTVYQGAEKLPAQKALDEFDSDRHSTAWRLGEHDRLKIRWKDEFRANTEEIQK